jgi:hypothetical protein
MPAITQELAIGIGFKKQTNTGTPTTTKEQLQTALTDAELWALNLNSFNVPFPELQNEDDGAFFGKGDEYPRTIYPTSINAQWEWPFHLTSQNWVMAIVYAVHNVTKSNPATGAFQYICTPPDRATQGVNLPATTVVTKIRDMLNLALIGMVCTGFTLRIQRGPGLQNTSMTSRWAGCGQYDTDAGLTVPELHVETRLGAGSMVSLILGGVDYFANARIVDIEYTWDNGVNLDSGYFPGSGQKNQYDLRGRMRYGRRTQSLVWSGEWENDSTELEQLEEGIESSCSLQLDGPVIASSTPHRAIIDLPRTRVKGLGMVEADGFVACRCDTTIMKSATEPWVTLTGITDKDNIGVSAA